VSVRRRAVLERLERDRNWRLAWADTDQTLADLEKVIDDALAEGRTGLTDEEWIERLQAVREARTKTEERQP
jgi:N-acyl-D-aspartate/D-glutamate deacylase